VASRAADARAAAPWSAAPGCPDRSAIGGAAPPRRRCPQDTQGGNGAVSPFWLLNY
jgi:hypothetical protein